MEDKDLFEQLRRGPLPRNGFDEELRQKIHERIQNPKRGMLRSWSLRWGRLSAAFALIAVILIGAWTWTSQSFGNHGEGTQASGEAYASNDPAAAAMTNKDVESAMLIGLRKDDEAGSTYRTILVVPDGQKLKVAADGPGIYMPYGQKFWKIDTVQDAMGKGMQTLVASPAESFTETSSSMLPVSSSRRMTEKLLYVGNKYVSILQTTTVSPEGKSVNENEMWVNEVNQLLPEVRERNADSVEYLHSSFADATGTEGASNEAGIEQWAIDRLPGEWVAKQPSASRLADNTSSLAEMVPIDKPLTDEVVRYNSLAYSWDDIYALQPTAKDAYTSPSPKEDILAIIVDDGISLYPYRSKDGLKEPLKLSTELGESVIMVQWAIVPKYIDSWTKLIGGWIPPAND